MSDALEKILTIGIARTSRCDARTGWTYVGAEWELFSIVELAPTLKSIVVAKLVVLIIIVVVINDIAANIHGRTRDNTADIDFTLP